MKIQSAGNGCRFVEIQLGDEWSTILDAFDKAVSVGPYACREEARRLLTEAEIFILEATARRHFPRHEVIVFRR